MPKATLFRDFKSAMNLTVLIAGLGYFVDLFDLTLFGVVRTVSLQDLGVIDPLAKGVFIYNAQMVGLMIGGLIWGWLGDKRGRISVLLGSILLYSAANIANAFVWDVSSYVVCRFLGGIGLAGELGAAITLVAELLPKEKRGLGTTGVAALGMLGIVTAALLGQTLPWRSMYVVGGVLGLSLLAMRSSSQESALFLKLTQRNPLNKQVGLMPIMRGESFRKYLCCLVIGLPLYFTTGLLFTFAPELTKSASGESSLSAAQAILSGSIGLAVGDVLSGLLSQRLKRRRLPVGIMLIAGLLMLWTYLGFIRLSPLLSMPLTTRRLLLEWICALIGTCCGYWAVLLTLSTEQFGTDVRARVATTVPNFVRGSAIFAVSATWWLRSLLEPHFDLKTATLLSALTVGSVCFGAALLCLWNLNETYGRDLDYLEIDSGS